MRKCPVCNGRGFKQFIQNYGGIEDVGSNAVRRTQPQKCRRRDCSLCKGKGKVTAQDVEKFESVKRLIAFHKNRRVLT